MVVSTPRALRTPLSEAIDIDRGQSILNVLVEKALNAHDDTDNNANDIDEDEANLADPNEGRGRVIPDTPGTPKPSHKASRALTANEAKARTGTFPQLGHHLLSSVPGDVSQWKKCWGDPWISLSPALKDDVETKRG
ncbi:hypothetical protein AYO22_05061 [Fonsecaea multimorphosa]|nr:hypothetical protein AYO22_05061 [Fonsecaea multimorphosa]